MRKSFFIFMFFVMLLGVSNAKANSCNEVSPNPSVGKFTKECINRILTNYITHFPTGFFVIEISKEMNVYVQGARQTATSFLLESVGSKYSDTVTLEVTNSLVKLGWKLPGGSGNHNQMISNDQINSSETTSLLYWTLDSYNLKQSDIIFTYRMDHF